MKQISYEVLVTVDVSAVSVVVPVIKVSESVRVDVTVVV